MQYAKEFQAPRRASTGFTLIEMMVAVTIFSMIMLMSVGTILSIVDANRKAQTIKTAVNNLNFAMENMVRNIRTGTNYSCRNPQGNGATPASIANAADCVFNQSTGGTILAMEAYGGNTSDTQDQLVYRFHGGRIYRFNGSGPLNTDESIALTSPDVVIQYMRFYVMGTSKTDGIQPMVKIVMKGYVEVGDVRTDFNLQTAVTQRNLDI